MNADSKKRKSDSAAVEDIDDRLDTLSTRSNKLWEQRQRLLDKRRRLLTPKNLRKYLNLSENDFRREVEGQAKLLDGIEKMFKQNYPEAYKKYIGCTCSSTATTAVPAAATTVQAAATVTTICRACKRREKQ